MEGLPGHIKMSLIVPKLMLVTGVLTAVLLLFQRMDYIICTAIWGILRIIAMIPHIVGPYSIDLLSMEMHNTNLQDQHIVEITLDTTRHQLH